MDPAFKNPPKFRERANLGYHFPAPRLWKAPSTMTSSYIGTGMVSWPWVLVQWPWLEPVLQLARCGGREHPQSRRYLWLESLGASQDLGLLGRLLGRPLSLLCMGGGELQSCLSGGLNKAVLEVCCQYGLSREPE